MSDVPLERFEAFVWDNPRHPRESILGYIHRVAVGVGAVAGDEGILTRTIPAPQPAEADPYANEAVPF